jgi:hypothetical protein
MSTPHTRVQEVVDAGAERIADSVGVCVCVCVCVCACIHANTHNARVRARAHTHTHTHTQVQEVMNAGAERSEDSVNVFG